jgi:tetratricopeptide (TPR) repeat protein
MSLSRSRWILNIVLIFALIAFLGLFTFPIVESLLQDNKTSAAIAPGVSTSKLEDQAKGYELVLQREPDNQTALRGLLEIKLQLGDLKGSVDLLERLGKLNPQQTDYMVLLAQARQQLGDLEAAVNAYRNVLITNPGDLNGLQGLSSLYLQQKRPEAAIGLLQETLKSADQFNQVQPGSIDVPSVQLLLGQLYVSEQRYTEAITIYDETIKANATDFRPLLAKGIVLQQQGKLSEAKPLFSLASSLAPPQYKDQIKQLSNTNPITDKIEQKKQPKETK